MRFVVPSYVIMWGLALSLYLLSKWMTWRTILVSARPSGAGGLFFLLGYPGMDPEEFLKAAERQPSLQEWTAALVKISVGVGLVWGVARKCYPAHPALAGWTGMIGLVFLLHFGLFHLLALMWQRVGFRARPIMRSPLLARSLADFWSARWNLAFHFLASRFLYLPMKRRFNSRLALLGTFLISGLVHELVITVPAGSGYGLPTVYFLLQGGGILLSQSRMGRRMGLRNGPAARAFAWCVTLLPVGCLFPIGFIRNVILPFLGDIGAL